MRTAKDYLDKLSQMRPNIYMDGELIGRDHPDVVRASNGIQRTFDLVDDPEFKELLTATSHISGKTINRFTHIHQNPEDLLKKQKLTRRMCNITGGCFMRCMGIDAMNALSVTTKNTDLKYGTKYYENFLNYLQYFQDNNIVASCAQTDSKGDRRYRPGEQPDPDQHLHVVERRTDGVVVRGAKLHNTMSPYADEIIAIPTRALLKTEADYAIAFAIPADTEGVYLIGRKADFYHRDPGMEAPIAGYADIESFTVFDDVFIPNERIFLNGETDMGGSLALLFALYHRHSYCGCKPGIGDILMGTAALTADYLGIEKMGHVKEKLAEMISVVELVFAAGIAASIDSKQAPSGTQVPNVIYANVGRRHAGHNIYHEYSTLCDIAGGLPASLPLSKEYNSPVVGEFVKKYVARREGVSQENHYRAAHLASDLLTSEFATACQIAGVHGGGSPIMEDIAIMGAYDVENNKKMAKYLAGIKDE